MSETAASKTSKTATAKKAGPASRQDEYLSQYEGVPYGSTVSAAGGKVGVIDDTPGRDPVTGQLSAEQTAEFTAAQVALQSGHRTGHHVTGDDARVGPAGAER